MTVFYPIWHRDIQDLLVLKNNRGTEDTRARHIDYGFQFNKLIYQRLIDSKNVSLFSPDVANGKLLEYFYSDTEKFIELYCKLEKDKSVVKKSIPAIELFILFAQERRQTGRIYLQNIDHSNDYGVFNSVKAPIKQSNLCVAPETLILTREGYQEIKSLTGKSLDVWNGEEWSKVDIVKTGDNQKLLTVNTSAGQSLDCTEYHKFYIMTEYGKPYKEVRASELKIGDKLIKFDLPVINGKKDLSFAYMNGFYSGDGCHYKNDEIIYLYGEKRKLAYMFSNTRRWSIQEKQDREVLVMERNILQEKFFVPKHNFTITSKLEWLAGWLDADGSVYKNGDNRQLVGSSVNLHFLKEVQMMLQTLGVSAKIRQMASEGFRKLPANDGSGENKDFLCKDSYRLLITSCDTYKLKLLGLNLQRLKLDDKKPQRDAKQFVKVTGVVDTGRFDETYCFTEYKRHMGMFNGILTGQCLEVTLPTQYIGHPDEEIALCTLAAYNLGKLIGLSKLQMHFTLEKLSRSVVRALDNLLDYQDYPVRAALKNKKRRTLGIGVIDYAHWLASLGLKYSDGSANNATHELFEAIRFFTMKASVELAKERGSCELFSDLDLQKIIPVYNYKKEVDLYHTTNLQLDWQWLKDEIEKFGIRNSTVLALMPSETSSIISNSTNGIEPPREYLTIKSSSNTLVKQVVPDVKKLYLDYELKWEQPDPEGYLILCGIMQKFVDQAISVNTPYDPSKFEYGKVPIELLIKHYLLAYKIGLKTLYYDETRDGNDQSDCESCKI